MSGNSRAGPPGRNVGGIRIPAALGAGILSLLGFALSPVTGTGGVKAQAVTASVSICVNPTPPIGTKCLPTPPPTPLPSAPRPVLPAPGVVLPGTINNPIGVGAGSLPNPTSSGPITEGQAGMAIFNMRAMPMMSSSDLAKLREGFPDPTVLSPLFMMLADPISNQPPDLAHFQPQPLTTNPQHRAATSGRPLLAQWQDQLLGLLILGLIILMAFRLRARPGAGEPHARRVVVLLPVGLAALIAGTLFAYHAQPLGAFSQSAPGARGEPVNPPADHQGRRGMAVATNDPWRHLLRVESSLSAEHTQLTELEITTKRLVLAASHQDELNREPWSAKRTQQVSGLVAQHLAVQKDYDANLRAEYDIYQQAAQNPAVRAALLAQAHRMGDGVTAIVAHNLSLVAVQAQQDALVNSSNANVSVTAIQPSALAGTRRFVPPATGMLTQAFGPTEFALEPPMEYRGTFYPHFHTGLDIAALQGTPIQATADGVVALVARMTDEHGKPVGYGNFVTILHRDGYLTLYAHLQSADVKVGQLVQQGQVIGDMGSTGWSTGPHLHFEIRQNGQLLDPLINLQSPSAAG